MGSLPSVSVVLSSKNDAKYIAETIESVLRQNYPSLELHVQDGGSTDGTLEIVRNYPVQWASEPDTGVPDAFNRGFRATRGELLVFLGADDPLMPDSIRVLAETLTLHPEAAFAYGDIEYIDASGKAYTRLKGRPLDLDDLFWGNHVPTQSVAMRRSALAAVGLYRLGIINADWDLWLRLGARFPSVYVPTLLGRYRIHAGSTTLKNLGRFARNVISVVDFLLQDPAITAKLRKGPARAFSGSYLMASSVFVMAGEMAVAKETYLKAVRRYPRAALSRRGVEALLALLLGPRLYYRVRNRGRGPG